MRRLAGASGLLAACGGLTEPSSVTLDAAAPAPDAMPDVAADAPVDCGDVLTDPQNCATCGHSCLGGACVGGNCQLVPIPAPGGAFAIALSDGDVVYTTSTGELWHVSKQGGSPQMLAPAIPVTFFNVLGLTVLDGVAYQASQAMNLVRAVPVSGGVPLTISTPAPTSLAQNGEDVFIGSDTAGLMQLAPMSTQPVLIEPAPTARVFALGLAVTATDAFVSRLDPQGALRLLERVPLGGGPVTSLGPHVCFPACPIATDGNEVFAIRDAPSMASVTALPVGAPGTPTTLSQDASYGGIAIDDEYVYYAQLQGPCTSPPCKAGLARVKKVFSLPTTLATNGDPIAIAVDSTAVYFSSTTGIVKLAKP